MRGIRGRLSTGRELPLEGALPLGVFAETEYPESAFVLAPGETCALYTDGLLEARDEAGELFGFTRLAKLFAGRPSAEEAAYAAVEFGQDDDITVVMITRTAAPAGATDTPGMRLDTGEAAVAG
ncbi:MAG TPA: SpoIIE family protein phosphatase [Terracidiphilus sp.]|nr:SpoIIE family protein phosphatase [Terracidiphilus sp.]